MAVIATIYCPITGRKGVEIKGLPTRYGDHRNFKAYGPDAFCKALKEWELMRPVRATVIDFKIARSANVF